MNKQEIVNAVAKRLGVTRARAAEITDLFFSQGGHHRLGAEAGREGRDLGLRPLRAPTARGARGARTRGPAASLTLKASIVPAFRAAKALKEMVNRKR